MDEITGNTIKEKELCRAVCWGTAVGQQSSGLSRELQRDTERQIGTHLDRQGNMKQLIMMEGIFR